MLMKNKIVHNRSLSAYQLLQVRKTSNKRPGQYYIFFSAVLPQDVTRSSTMEKKDIGVVVCCRQPSSRKVD